MIHNPIIRGFNPDPSITYDGERYVIAVSTFEYYPGIALYTSPDLSSWEYAGSALTEENGFSFSGCRNSSGIYAPAIRFHDGLYYITSTDKNGKGNFIISSRSVSGPWSNAKWIHPEGIDPSIMFLDDGRCFYTQNGKGGIYGAFIDPDSGRLLEELRLISPGLSGYATEAPHIYQKDGMFYLLFAEGGTEYGHHEIAGRSDSVYGPYELRTKPVLSHTERKGHIIQATGHADLIQTEDGRWIAVFLAIRVFGKPLLHHLGRETFMAEVNWKDGWPVIGDDGRVELDLPSDIETRRQDIVSISSPEDIAALPILRVRAPHSSDYSVIDGQLAIHGRCPLSESYGEPSVLLLRQTEPVISFSAMLRTDLSLTGIAGITVFYNSDYHADIAVNRTEEAIEVFLRRRIHDLETVAGRISMPLKDSVSLSVKADSSSYSFYIDGSLLGQASTASFSTEGTMYMTFTGTLIGVFCEEGDAVFNLPLGFHG